VRTEAESNGAEERIRTSTRLPGLAPEATFASSPTVTVRRRMLPMSMKADELPAIHCCRLSPMISDEVCRMVDANTTTCHSERGDHSDRFSCEPLGRFVTPGPRRAW